MNFECRTPKSLTSLFNIRYWVFDIKKNLMQFPFCGLGTKKASRYPESFYFKKKNNIIGN